MTSLFNNLTVRSKLFSITIAVALLFGATIVGLGVVAKRHVVSSVQTEIERSQQVTAEFFKSRYRQLDAGLNSLVDSPEIRAVLTTEGIDHDTQLMSIIDLQHMLGADAILYCNAKGRTLARTDDPFDEESIVKDIPIIESALGGQTSRGFWELDDQTMLAIAFSVVLDDEVMGVVCAGVDISGDADRLKSLLMRDVAISRNGSVMTCSLAPEIQQHWERALSDEAASIENTADLHKLRRIQLESEPESEHLAAVVPFAPAVGNELRAIVMIPNSAVFGFYSDFKSVLLWMGTLTTVLSILVIRKIGSIISGQVNSTLQTLEQVANGDLSSRLNIGTKDEFGRIAEALNTAISSSAETLEALAVRNRDTRTLLDAVEQGFFTIDSDGVMSDERSGAVERVFGSIASGTTLPQFIAQFDAKAAEWIEMGIEDAFEEMMPLEVTLDQMPNRFRVDEKFYSIEYTPVRQGEQLSSIAVVISDITAIVENEKLESKQREMMAMVHRIAEDRSGFLDFVRESDAIVDSLRNDTHADLVLVKRRVHTLKGNTAIYGLHRMAQACHEIEDYIAENETDPDPAAMKEMFGKWDTAKANIQQIVGDQDHGIEIDQFEFDALLADVLAQRSYHELAARISAWPLEQTLVRLNRISEQATALADRLGKGEIHVNLEDNGLRLESDLWSEFWSSLIHVVRNSVDHGLETPDDRIAMGKQAQGRLDVSTFIQQQEFVVRIEDDGRGIDWDKVTEAAYKKGLPAETRSDLVDALFADGVSTAEVVSDTSGRGVGMAAVKETCESLGGVIRVTSELGQGTTVEFRFPDVKMAPSAVNQLQDSVSEKTGPKLQSQVYAWEA